MSSAASAGVRALLHPRNVALVGASNRPQSMGMNILAALRLAKYPGAIYPVNARYEDVAGLRCYPSLPALPEPPDHVVVAVPAAGVADVLREAIACRAGSATIMSAGFESRDAETAARRAEIESLVRESGLPLSGPNCTGNFSASAHFMTLAEARVPPVERGSVAVAGQSGGVTMSIYRTLWDRGMASAYVVTSGDELGLCGADYLEFFVGDDDVRVIVYYLEGLREPQRFAAACRAATRAGKRVVLFKIGQSARGREAAASHTGSMLGSMAAFDALIASTGAVRVQTIDEAVEAAEFLAYAAPPRGGRVGAIVFSGGLKGMTADAAERGGIELATLAPATLETLAPLIPTGGSLGNPLDFGALRGGTFDRYLECVRALRRDPNVDVVLCQEELLRSSSPREAGFRELDALVANEPGPPIALFSMISHSVTDYGRALRAKLPHLAFLQEPTKALRVVGAIGAASARYRDDAGEARSSPVLVTRASPLTLLESEAKTLLARYGIAVPRERVARSRAEAQEAAAAVGFPVVLKVLSRHVTHKSDVGGVVVGLADAAAVGAAYDRILRDVAAAAGPEAIDGMLVAQQIAGGTEMIVGIARDPEVGPVVMLGLGGVLAELLDDVVTAAPPIDLVAAAELVERLRGARVLHGYRGRARTDVPALCAALVALGRLALERPDLRELDVNPLVVLEEGAGAFALDALAIVDRSE